MEHALEYVGRPRPGSCFWRIYCTCKNDSTNDGLLGAIAAHPPDGSCASAAVGVAHDVGREVWLVREIDATHVQFEPSINTQVGPDPRWHHFHTGNPTGPVEVRD